ncbi:DUF998 domain-containing protein [Winogradskyella sp.]|uniref:DUF998 domain-containing protein n=1 Tax=Winogradskyella sp. TaxID=1883156 RepID=UPI00345B8FB2
MNNKILLHLGWITSTLFILGTIIFALLLQDYSQISQTISEIGEQGSLLRNEWQLFSIGTSCLLLLFSIGLIRFSVEHKLSIVPCIFLLLFSLSEIAIGFFPSPHYLHNIFGLSLIIGYFSPLLFALKWRNQLGTSFITFSIYAFIIIISGVIMNLLPIFVDSSFLIENYGIIQRYLIYSFYTYCAYVSIRSINRIRTKKSN